MVAGHVVRDDAVLTTDNGGNNTFLNPVAQTLTGWSLEDSVGKLLESVFQIINEQTRESVESPTVRALRDGVIVELANHTLLISQDVTERPIDDSAAPIRNVAGVVLIFRDVTDRNRHEHLMQDALTYADNIIATVREPFLVLDFATGKIVDANPFMSDLLGYSLADFSGKELLEIGLFNDKSANEAAVQDLQAHGYLRYEHLPLVWNDGRRVEVEIVANAYAEDRERVIQYNIRDITDRSRLEKLLRGPASELSDLHRRKDEFLAMLSPLAPIANAVQLLGLQKRNESRVQQQARAIIERQLRQPQHLVDDLLEVSRITTGRVQLRLERATVSSIVTGAVETVRPSSHNVGTT